MGNKYTEAQKRATYNYLANHVDKIALTLPKGTKDRWRAEAYRQGKSLTRFIVDSVEKELPTQ